MVQVNIRNVKYKLVILSSVTIFVFLWAIVNDSRTDEPRTIVHVREFNSEVNIMNRALLDDVTEDMFSKALIAGNRRSSQVTFTIGISTIQRPENTSYIFNTINSLIENYNETQEENIVIVILLADFSEKARKNMLGKLKKRYADYLESGLIQIIQAPRSFYPDLTNLKTTYNHPMLKVRWRSKQNYDFAFLMLYSRPIAKYYLQLEDDVTTVRNYVTLMEEFIRNYQDFVCLEFSELGFIAKLFKSTDLEKLAKFLMLFYNEQPNDVTYLHFNELLLQFRRIIRKPTLFQHHGFYSSLKLKQENLKDMFFVESNSSEVKKPIPVLRRSENGIRGPEEDVWIEKIRIKNAMKT